MASVTTEVTWNPFTEGYFENPYPHLQLCRETNPVQKGNNGEWILLRHDHIKEALRSPDYSPSDLPEFFRKKEPIIFKNTTQCPYLARTTSHWLPYLDGLQHETARHLVDRVLSRFDLKTIISDCLRQLFDEHVAGDSFDATVAGAALPVLIFNTLYGGSWSTGDDIRRLQKVSHSLATSQDIFVPISRYQSINQDMQWFVDTVTHDFEANIANRPLLAYLEEENQSLNSNFTRDELTSIAGILFFGSIETTQISMSNIIYEMMKDRSLISYVVNADDISTNVLAEEFLRYIAPQQYTIRVNHKNLHLDGNDIPPGSRLFLCLASANRDPAVFPEPDKIVLERKNNPHLSFGSGVHACAGSKLSRMELRALLKPLASALINYELDPAFRPEWHRSIFIRGIKEIRIVRK